MSNSANSNTAFAANLAELTSLLQQALRQVVEASDYITDGNRTAAAGAILDLDRLLSDAVALHGATMALHRRAN